jgi:hypothetical protein
MIAIGLAARAAREIHHALNIVEPLPRCKPEHPADERAIYAVSVIG